MYHHLQVNNLEEKNFKVIHLKVILHSTVCKRCLHQRVAVAGMAWHYALEYLQACHTLMVSSCICVMLMDDFMVSQSGPCYDNKLDSIPKITCICVISLEINYTYSFVMK